ncbi:MAG TPA: hypothetical protein VFB66_28865 [Tepidisphaeraceae bacterium]|nr:hypothetical protein [Tepidisphaeraceae bacterium]
MVSAMKSAESDMDDFCTGLSPKDRTNVEKHLAACDAEALPDRGRLWRRLALGLRRLGPFRPQTTGYRAVQFFVADGKYKMQLFALEDPRDGTLVVYAPDAVEEAIDTGVLRGPVEGEEDATLYEVCAMPGVTIKIEPLTAQNSPTAPDYYKHMLGWNRKAVRITLPVNATPSQVLASELLYELAARRATVR